MSDFEMLSIMLAMISLVFGFLKSYVDKSTKK